MGQFRCLTCRTLPLAGHRFCYVCGAAFPGPVPAAAVRAEVEVEGTLDARRVGILIAGFAGLMMLGIAACLLNDVETGAPMGALFLIAGACSLVWALQPRGERGSGFGVALDVLRLVILYLLLALAVGSGILILLVYACKSILHQVI